MAKVGIVMGSDSDMPVMSKAADVLAKLGVDFEMTIISAHREPDVFFEYAKSAEANRFQSDDCRCRKSSSSAWHVCSRHLSYAGDRNSHCSIFRHRAAWILCILLCRCRLVFQSPPLPSMAVPMPGASWQQRFLATS